MTKDHSTYAECLRSANIKPAATVASNNGEMYDKTRKDLRAYEIAKANGISPRSTHSQAVKEAEQATKLLGRPYDAQFDPPAQMIQTKTAAKFVNTEG